MIDVKKYFYFDIETSRKYETFSEFNKVDPRGAALFEKKIKNKFKDSAVDDAFLEFQYKDLGGLLPEYGRIVCLSYGLYKPTDGKKILGHVAEEDELLTMKKIKQVFDKIGELGLVPCGYNIKGFDIPYVFKKLVSHGLTVPTLVNTFNKKPWDIQMLDLQDVWKSTSMNACTFDEFAYSLGVNSPKDEMCGSEVGDAYFKGKLDDIVKYCNKDVNCCIECVDALSKVM